ncbi:hypothetical protein GGS23DRAFT_216941 [Durotheca rogersii]|uniref:uncharacterized protein n=1 Tax=Durotheca rogersii TaxID=419775 RepID=UPI00221F6EB4|nr:uncharacterized protein GGS23DRAFT_216941 [Durotheca rogersii]KAI5860921.1 hypothetical protein GGS23DRAFT_216941 [Durotheca rogersii]
MCALRRTRRITCPDQGAVRSSSTTTRTKGCLLLPAPSPPNPPPALPPAGYARQTDTSSAGQPYPRHHLSCSHPSCPVCCPHPSGLVRCPRPSCPVCRRIASGVSHPRDCSRILPPFPLRPTYVSTYLFCAQEVARRIATRHLTLGGEESRARLMSTRSRRVPAVCGRVHTASPRPVLSPRAPIPSAARCACNPRRRRSRSLDQPDQHIVCLLSKSRDRKVASDRFARHA